MNITKSDFIKKQLEMNTLKSTVQRQQAEITRQQSEIDQLKAENARLKDANEERVRGLQQMRAADNARGIDMNHLKERSAAVQRLAEALKAKHDDMKEWYNSRNTKITDGVKKINDGFEIVRKRVNIMWVDRCKQQEALKKRHHDSEDPGNPDPSAISEQPPAAESTKIAAFEPPQIESTQGTSSGAVEEIQQLESSSYVEGSLADASVDEMKAIDDASIDNILSEPETADIENIDEIVFEGETRKSTYVREDGTEFNPFDEDWLKDHLEDIDEKLKNRDSTNDATESFKEWRKLFLSKVAKPTPSETQVDYLKFDKEKPRGKILSWMFVKEIHCMAIKREHGIQYFRSLLSILSLQFYDVAALSKLELINHSKYKGATLFGRRIKINRRIGWKDELYKPQFPMYQQIKFTLDPSTNTTRYKLVYQPEKVMDKIPLMPMKQNFLEKNDFMVL
ncbi:hypothetical protein HanHA300_Chr02g0061981 [Helianthus annuus]|nr:hypothetical protein HanHA300_Chr02g0061981 [Helianthus annuus]KAJ0619361.1 hypothetical protein HanHA89_Chr02g0070491 [Helianthus annuus]